MASPHARSWRRTAGPALGFALLVACGGDGGTAPPGQSNTVSSASTPSAISVVSGSGQSAAPGSALSAPLVVRVTSATGAALAGATVDFTISGSAGTLTASSAVTDAGGLAATTLTLGAAATAVQVTATVRGTALNTTFSATAATPPTSAACAAAPLTLAAGQTAVLTGAATCVSVASSGEYALIPYNTSLDFGANASVSFLPTGTSTAGAPLASRAPLASAGSEGATALASLAARAQGLDGADLSLPATFERALREQARTELRPLLAEARSWHASRSAAAAGTRRLVIPGTAAVGSLFQLNVGGEGCSSPQLRTVRVEAVTNRAIVVADTLNPSTGFTRPDYESVAVTFDTLIDVVDRRNFGAPADIDGNGRVVLLYTSAVNALTPRNSDSYIGGYFSPRDLFPTRTRNGLPGCAASNEAEMFYLLVPDPSGIINGNRFSKEFVARVTLGTVAHEYEHLINSSRRLYVNTQAEQFEETWLDEGLAHIAEELVFYARTGLAPGRNIDGPTLRSSIAITNAFVEQGSANFRRLETFLNNPSRNSPIADNDSLATRGATWAFLRYAADQTQPAGVTSQETIWQRLVNSTTSGIPNLRTVFGSDVAGLFRDWGTMLLLDDVAGAAARYQFPSWNLRSVFGALNSSNSYPLRTTVLASGTTTNVLLPGGSVAYLRFGVATGGTGSVSWSALPSNVALTVVRIR